MDLKLGTEGFDGHCKKCGKYHWATRYAFLVSSIRACRCPSLQNKKKNKNDLSDETKEIVERLTDVQA